LLHECRNCQQYFPLRTKLFKHLKACAGRCEEPASAYAGTANTIENICEKVSNAPPLGVGTRMGYRGFTYATAAIRLLRVVNMFVQAMLQVYEHVCSYLFLFSGL